MRSILISACATTAILLLAASPVQSKDAFVFLGATGDNALRPAGVWSGLYEAFAGGVFNKDTVEIHVAMNAPHTVSELHDSVVQSLTPLYTELKNNTGWKCRTKDGNCSPERLLQDVVINIHAGRDADAQAKNMTASLSGAGRITVYLSVPAFVFAGWSKAAVDNWGEGSKHRVHVAAEKPFGTSLSNADTLRSGIIDAGVPEENLHLVDHWLSFFMNRHLPAFRKIVQPRLGIDFSAKDIGKIVVTEFELRDLAGRGGFFDGVGQVRDMIQSHLLQVMALLMIDPDAPSRPEAKLAIFNQTNMHGCDFGQYDGWLLEPKLKYHPSFADSTLCYLHFEVGSAEWKGVEIVIQTGKSMGATLYTVEVHQRSGPGVLYYEVGKEEVGLGAIHVTNWPLKDSSGFSAPAPGFSDSATIQYTPKVSAAGDGLILNYDAPGLYFPKPYAMMAAALLKADYGLAFVTWPECQRSWEIVNATDGKCLDPPAANVPVYKPPASCGNTPPNVCWLKTDGRNETVQDLYDDTFKCTPAHDHKYANISLYQAKCHPSRVGA